MGSLRTIRFGLERYLKTVTCFDITNDEGFNEVNEVFAAKCVQLKKEGLAKVQHTPSIHSPSQKLYWFKIVLVG